MPKGMVIKWSCQNILREEDKTQGGIFYRLIMALREDVNRVVQLCIRRTADEAVIGKGKVG